MQHTADVDAPGTWSSLDELHEVARRKLPPERLQLIDGGAGSGRTIEHNEAAFGRWALRPRALSGVDQVDLSTTVLGSPLRAPLMFSPSGLHGLAHPDGELASARAARAHGLLMVLSSNGSRTVEDVARQQAPLWFQFYWGRNRDEVAALLQRAQAAGCRAVCLTIDMPTRPWLHGTMRGALARIGHMPSAHGRPRSVHLDRTAEWEHDARLTWSDLSWLRGVTSLPLVVKGVMTGRDAALAVEHGAAAVIVSNHGGRCFDAGQGTLDVLAEVVDAVAGRAEVYIDGGIRRGTDIAIALAMGARAVLVGRPVQWGLGAAGEAGVSRMVELLLDELRSVMTMLGTANPGALGAAHLAPALR